MPGGGGMFKLRFGWYITFFYHAIYLSSSRLNQSIRTEYFKTKYWQSYSVD